MATGQSWLSNKRPMTEMEKTNNVTEISGGGGEAG